MNSAKYNEQFTNKSKYCQYMFILLIFRALYFTAFKLKKNIYI